MQGQVELRGRALGGLHDLGRQALRRSRAGLGRGRFGGGLGGAGAAAITGGGAGAAPWAWAPLRGQSRAAVGVGLPADDGGRTGRRRVRGRLACGDRPAARVWRRGARLGRRRRRRPASVPLPWSWRPWAWHARPAGLSGARQGLRPRSWRPIGRRRAPPPRSWAEPRRRKASRGRGAAPAGSAASARTPGAACRPALGAGAAARRLRGLSRSALALRRRGPLLAAGARRGGGRDGRGGLGQQALGRGSLRRGRAGGGLSLGRGGARRGGRGRGATAAVSLHPRPRRGPCEAAWAGLRRRPGPSGPWAVVAALRAGEAGGRAVAVPAPRCAPAPAEAGPAPARRAAAGRLVGVGASVGRRRWAREPGRARAWGAVGLGLRGMSRPAGSWSRGLGRVVGRLAGAPPAAAGGAGLQGSAEAARLAARVWAGAIGEAGRALAPLPVAVWLSAPDTGAAGGVAGEGRRLAVGGQEGGEAGRRPPAGSA